MKTHVNVGTIGHVDHGKTTLTAAILAVQAHAGFAKVKSYADIAKGGTVRDETKTVTIAISHVAYETETRHYAHIDCPEHADYVKNMITGAAQMDGAILLVDGSQGPQFQTKERILPARQVGVERIVVFINKIDIADAELLELVVSEANEALELQGYKGAPVVMGSALKALRDPADEGACIRELLQARNSNQGDRHEASYADSQRLDVPPLDRHLAAGDLLARDEQDRRARGVRGRGFVAFGDDSRSRGRAPAKANEHAQEGREVLATECAHARRLPLLLLRQEEGPA